MLSEEEVRVRLYFLSKFEFTPRLEEFIKESWRMISAYPRHLLAFPILHLALLYLCFFLSALDLETLSFVCACLSCLSWVFVCLVTQKMAHLITIGKIPSYKNLYNFHGKFLTVFAVYIVSLVLISVGFFLIFIPGAYLALSFTFVFPLYLFTELSGLKVLEISRRMTANSIFQILYVKMAIGLFFFFSILFTCGLGLILAIPMTNIWVYLAFSDMMDLHDGNPLETLGKGVEYRDESLTVL